LDSTCRRRSRHSPLATTRASTDNTTGRPRKTPEEKACAKIAKREKRQERDHRSRHQKGIERAQAAAKAKSPHGSQAKSKPSPSPIAPPLPRHLPSTTTIPPPPSPAGQTLTGSTTAALSSPEESRTATTVTTSSASAKTPPTVTTVHDEDDDYHDDDDDDDPSLVVSSASTARKIKDKLRKKINRLLADKRRRKSVSFPADLLPAEEDQERDQEQDEEFFYDLEVDEIAQENFKSQEGAPRRPFFLRS
jgi:hypothetical protein